MRKDTSVYASYIEGLEQGPIVPITASDAGVILPPAVSQQVELGVRTEALTGVLANMTVFQLERATRYTNADHFVALDGRAVIKGVEASINGGLARGVSLHASAMLLDPVLKRAATAALAGKTPDNMPRVTASILPEYRPLGWPGLRMNPGAHHTGKRFIHPLNQAEIPSCTIVTAGLGCETRVGSYPVSLQANVGNLSNERYWEAGGAGSLAVGAPRTLSVTAEVELKPPCRAPCLRPGRALEPPRAGVPRSGVSTMPTRSRAPRTAWRLPATAALPRPCPPRPALCRSTSLAACWR